MAKIYANLVKQGAWTLEQVPEKWKTEVEALLNT